VTQVAEKAGEPGRPEAPGESQESGARRFRRRIRDRRGTVAIVVVVLATALLLAITADREAGGRLRPDAYGPEGSAALATLLTEQGVAVDVARTPDDAMAAGRGTTLFVADPGQLGRAGRAVVARSGADVVLVRPDGPTLTALVPGVEPASPFGLPSGVRTPDCPLRAATAAGPADLAADTYVAAPGDLGCYPVAGASSLVVRAGGGRTVTVVGDDEPFANASLGRSGNAALTLGLLGTHPRLLWYLPVPLADPGDQQSLTALIPAGWRWAVVQLLVAAILAALWRGRRFGRVVPERLPVVVRATETTEGRARLYRRADARDRAAEALRSETRRRLAARLGLARTAPAAAVAQAVAGTTGRPAPAVAALLDGPPPADDRALVALASDLDALAAAASGTAHPHIGATGGAG